MSGVVTAHARAVSSERVALSQLAAGLGGFL